MAVRPLFFFLTFLATAGLLLGVWRGEPAWLIAGASLFSVLYASHPGPARWAGAASATLGSAGLLALHPAQRGAVTPVAAGLLIAGSVWLVQRQTEQGAKFDWQRSIIRALRNGSTRLSDARTEEAVIRAGMAMFGQLQVAHSVAFVAYREGVPYLIGATGAFEPFLEKPLSPSDDDTRSVQADHWVAEEVLALIKRPQRQSFYITDVYGGDEKHLGLLILTRPNANKFSDSEKEVVRAFTRLVGAQLGQLHAIRSLRESNELTLRSLGAALEYRDDETSGHTQRVVNLSMRLGRRLGWDEEQVRALRWGAYLHDLGKIAIPDRILHKNGPLDAQEQHVIRSHTAVGYEMLQDLYFLPAETLDLVRYHHERWDGTGYPSGLRGTNIPDSARIFSIVDVYDALTSERPYKAAWSRERALQEIRAGAGAHFDPQYVDAFLHLMAEEDDAHLVR